jgi:large subunit ribosomal protein L13
LALTRKIEIEGHEYTQHRDDFHMVDEQKYSAVWKQEGMYTGGKRPVEKQIADDVYLFDQGIIPQKQLMSAYYSIEKEGKIWHVFNAENMYWFTLINKVSQFIRGKHKPIYKPNQTKHGDKCIVVNVGKARMKGQRLKYWTYHYHSGWPGGLKVKQYRKMLNLRPEMLLYKDVYRSLPKNKLRNKWLENLSAFRGPHHSAPEALLPNFAERPPMDKVALLPDGHFEEMMQGMQEGPSEEYGWGGVPCIFFL